jgi:SAM-dependent methyltransferase
MMTTDAQYIHGTAPEEQARLAILNRLTNQTFITYLEPRDGMRVLEVGSGLGLLACEVASSANGVMVTGVEKSPQQLAAARQQDNVTYLEGDAHNLDFPDESFDLVYARYLLEHVGDPERVLREMRRVAKPGARVVVCENDISLLRVDPPCRNFERVWERFAQLQEKLGGDALIGRRLHRLFKSAGFDRVELTVQPEVHGFDDPGFAPWIRNLVGNVESGRDSLIREGLASTGEVEAAIADLNALLKVPSASNTFVWNRASAVR